jgi:hypothetical protein
MSADTSFKIHLLRAPDYAPAEYFELCKILQALPMPGWEFVPAEKELFPEDSPYHQSGRRMPEDVKFEYYSPVHKLMYQAGRDYPLSWKELFRICRYYRKGSKIPDRNFLVLLTERPNALNWFSAFDDSRHIFVHTNDWEKFIKCSHQYPVAYEVIANVLQSQMQIDTIGKDACLHEETIGCMNDFCLDKRAIAMKLRTADICADCSERLHKCEVAGHLVEAALQGFGALRKQMLFSQGFRQRRGVGLLKVSWLYDIRFMGLGSMPVDFTPMEKTLYSFFLKHPEGTLRKELDKHRELLLKIYGRVSGNDARVQHERINRLVKPIEGAFNENRTRINNKLEKRLGKVMSRPYLITGSKGGVYRVPIASEPGRVEFEEDFFRRANPTGNQNSN